VDTKYRRSSGNYDLRRNLSEAHIPNQASAPAADSEWAIFSDSIARAAVKIDLTYTPHLQSHAMMEPTHTGMWDGDKLILHTANQMLNQGQQAIATTLKFRSKTFA